MKLPLGTKTYLLCDEFTVLAVVTNAKTDKFWELPEYINYQVFEWSCEEEEPWVVGTKLPLYENYRYRVIKGLGAIIQSPMDTDWAAYQQGSLARVKQWPQLWDRCRQQLTAQNLADWEQRFQMLLNKEALVVWSAEKNYRTYRARSYVFEIANLLLAMVGESEPEHIEDLVRKIERNQFSDLLQNQLREINRNRYSDYKNDTVAWNNDQALLLGAFYTFQQAFKELLALFQAVLEARVTIEQVERVQALWHPLQRLGQELDP